MSLGDAGLKQSRLAGAQPLAGTAGIKTTKELEFDCPKTRLEMHPMRFKRPGPHMTVLSSGHDKRCRWLDDG